MKNWAGRVFEDGKFRNSDERGEKHVWVGFLSSGFGIQLVLVEELMVWKIFLDIGVISSMRAGYKYTGLLKYLFEIEGFPF